MHHSSSFTHVCSFLAVAAAVLLVSTSTCGAHGHRRPAKPSSALLQQAKARVGRSLLANGTFRYQKPYNVCTSEWSPIVTCADVEDPADFSGFQVALWREIAKDLGWKDDDWTFTCVDWTAMLDDLVDPNGLCSFAAAGVEVSMPNIVLGLKFSWPIYKSGFHVLISSAVEEGGMWAFAEAFDWSVWVVLGATAIVVSLLISTAEVFTFGNQANRKGLRGWSWYSMGKMVQIPTHVGDPKTWASRVLVLGYAFLALIIVHLFTATTASKLTMQRLANDITSKADLPGKKVESWEPYVPLLRKYSIDADALPWDSDADTVTMLENLRTRKYQALILDSPVVQYLAAQASTCDLYPVGDPFETFNLAIAFPPDSPDDLPANISASIVRLQTTAAILDQLENIYVKSSGAEHGADTAHSADTAHDAGCSSAAQAIGEGGHAADPQIHLDQVAGLWYILLMTLGIALVTAMIQRLVHDKQLRARIAGSLSGKHRRVAAGGADSDGGASAGHDCVAEVVAAEGAGKGATGGKAAAGGSSNAAGRAAAGGGGGAAPGGQEKGGQPRQAAALKVEGLTAVQAFASPKGVPGQLDSPM